MIAIPSSTTEGNVLAIFEVVTHCIVAPDDLISQEIITRDCPTIYSPDPPLTPSLWRMVPMLEAAAVGSIVLTRPTLLLAGIEER